VDYDESVAPPPEPSTGASSPPLVVGKYELRGRIASGGMATVHLGRLVGLAGFSRTVAIKRLHPHLAQDQEFSAMFLDEARLAARVRHPNVVPVLDVVSAGGEILIVMEYVRGVTLASLVRATMTEGSRPSRDEPTKLPALPLDVASTIITGVLHGLQAAHDAKDDAGHALHIVHRDVSPQNVLVGLDGVARVLDFGVAKAEGRLNTTREGTVKGKLAYMPPEQLRGSVDRRTDVYSAAVVLWEALTLKRLFTGDGEAEILTALLTAEIEPPSRYAAHVPPALDAIVLKALSRSPEQRFASARDMALAVEEVVPPAGATRVAEWVAELSGGALSRRAQDVLELETQAGSFPGSANEASALATRDTHREASTQATTIVADERETAVRTSTPRGKSILLGLGAVALAAGGAFALMRVSSKAREPPSVMVSSSSTPSGAPIAAASTAPSATNETKSGVLRLSIPRGYSVKVDGFAPGSAESHTRWLESDRLELTGPFQRKFLVAVYDERESRVIIQDVYLYDNELDPPALEVKARQGVADKTRNTTAPAGSQGRKVPAAPNPTGELPARF
jgi:eukaryotic-like serine/threonine-protein kinase